MSQVQLVTESEKNLSVNTDSKEKITLKKVIGKLGPLLALIILVVILTSLSDRQVRMTIKMTRANIGPSLPITFFKVIFSFGSVFTERFFSDSVTN